LGKPGHLARHPGTLTVFNIVVREREGRILHENRISADGQSYVGAKTLGRKIGEFVLDPGIYDISVTLINNVPELAQLETSLEVTYRPKSSAIR
jgi:hypothetical protein